MTRIAQTLPITPKMYRHFAVITVVLTAALALFADGERQEMLKSELARNQSPGAPAAKQEDARFAAARARNERASRKSARAMAGGEAGSDSRDGSFAPDANLSGGRPARSGRPAMMAWGSVDDDTASNGQDFPMPGMSAEMQRKISMQKRKQARVPEQPNQKQLDAMLEMSAARSGTASGDVSE